MLRRGSAFNGYSIEATDGKVGTVADVLFDDTTWQLRWLVVDTGGWLTGRKILIHPSSLEQPDIEGRAFPVKLTREKVEASPGIAEDEPVSLQMDHDKYRYYWPTDGAFGGAGVVEPVILPASRVVESAPNGKPDRHLRSIAEVSGYAIHAIDGHIGHLETFLIDDETWAINYLVVDTANWWIGKHVLVAPSAVKEIDWLQRFVRLGLTCYKIKGSPAWDNAGIIDKAYEQLLRIYYGWGNTGEALAPAAGAPITAPSRVGAPH
jgi:sporulation protein YlmC with PRC-barrel domain